MNPILNSLPVQLLIHISLRIFKGYTFFFILTFIPLSSLSVKLCACFYVLDETAIFAMFKVVIRLVMHFSLLSV